ncbi:MULTISPECIES: hypothetical protein [Cupriavidus]|jgi:hypothetical protein|uniref:Uncharacterized protein n=1 Tax=Cupriavidus metallidurans TaxID=119219 RepID=A0A482J124_9BURK|nr:MULTISPECIES: hypothetical protein [Cupriavidus]KWR71428.1 hypothetical protein RN01_31625 [Cupriavidus sp. SHE]QBP13836.1 hypothetical protein DDF84_030190 [Cupriavidus metallidurans]QWC91612.1 hypothetical protein KB891_17750 [Cupriavidus metallidurans]
MNPVKKAIFTLTLLGAPVPAFSASMIIDSIVERSAIETGAILRAQANVRSRLSYPGSASFSGVVTAFAPSGVGAHDEALAVCGWVLAVANSGKKTRTRFISLQAADTERPWQQADSIADIKHALSYVDDGIAESANFDRYWSACMQLSAEQRRTASRVR